MANQEQRRPNQRKNHRDPDFPKPTHQTLQRGTATGLVLPRHGGSSEDCTETYKKRYKRDQKGFKESRHANQLADLQLRVAVLENQPSGQQSLASNVPIEQPLYSYSNPLPFNRRR